MNDTNLYVNLTDKQIRRLDDIEHDIREALRAGCKKEDILDTVHSIVSSTFNQSTNKEK